MTENQKKHNVLVLEDDGMLRELIRNYLNYSGIYECTNAYESFDVLKKVAPGADFRAILLDINMPGTLGVDAILPLKQMFPEADIVMLTSYDDSELVFKAICNGANGYLLKNTPLEQIKNSLDMVIAGGSPLSPEVARIVFDYFKPKKKKIENPLTAREEEIVAALVDGLSYKLVADRLNISIDTVRQHIRHIYRKLNVNSKAEVISKSLKGEI